MEPTINATHFKFPNQTSLYKGKVREVYTIGSDLLVVITSDRLSAFDVILPRQIPYKGQILNQIAAKMMKATEDLVPNWLLAVPDENVSVGHLCVPYRIEMIVRGYLAGHAAREYKMGKRTICGVQMPQGMKENDPFPSPMITPSTKAIDGKHDEDISKDAILANGIVDEEEYCFLEDCAVKLFQRGSEIAAQRGLILVDAKYEFGKTSAGKIVLIDEIHTPDSSRYFYRDGYEERQAKGTSQRQLSKEFVRQWLIENGFQGREGQQLPEISDKKVEDISNRYIELFEQITGETFIKSKTENMLMRIQKNVTEFLDSRR